MPSRTVQPLDQVEELAIERDDSSPPVVSIYWRFKDGSEIRFNVAPEHADRIPDMIPGRPGGSPG